MYNLIKMIVSCKELIFMKIFSLDIGGTAIKSALMDESGILHQNEYHSEAKKGGPYIIEQAIKIISSETQDFDAIGISTAGEVDSKSGSILFANDNIPNYTGTNVKDIIEKKFNKKTAVENDVNCAALGELHFGAAKNASSFICLTYGTGIGGSIVIDRKLYTGFSGQAGMFGRIILHTDQKSANTGYGGCYEVCASATALINMSKSAGLEPNNGREFFSLIYNGNKTANSVLDIWTKEVASGLVTLIYILNPKLVILGGGIMNQEPAFRMTKGKVESQLIDSFSSTSIVHAQLGNNAGLFGAFYLASEALKN